MFDALIVCILFAFTNTAVTDIISSYKKRETSFRGRKEAVS